MSNCPTDYDAVIRDLNDLVVNCPDLAELESMLGSFNIFQVLRSEFGELKHSNVLAWLLDPAEAHGLGASFLQKWLMHVLHDSPSGLAFGLAPVDVDAWDLIDAEVYREWNYIDILLVLKMQGGESWVVCIENKVKASQSPGQLEGYRKVVEMEFPNASRRLYLFLTKNREMPADAAYIPASYTQVHRALKETVAQRHRSIGDEPRVLIDNYLRLLEEKFMNESEIAKTVLNIYRKHERALKVIFEHQPHNIRAMIVRRVARLLEDSSLSMGIVMQLCDDLFIRFLPSSWDDPGNRHGTAWKGYPAHVIFEIDFNFKHPRFMAIAANAPPDWTQMMSTKASNPPFRRIEGYVRHESFPAFHAEDIGVSVALEDVIDPAETARTLFEWIRERLPDPDMGQIIDSIHAELPALGKHCTAQVS